MHCIVEKHSREVQVWGSTASPFNFPTTYDPREDPGSYNSKVNSWMASATSLPVESKEKVPHPEEVVVPDSKDEESGKVSKESLARPVVFNSSINTGLGMFLILVLILGLGVSSLTFEAFTDGSYLRFALVATVPLFVVLSMFFAIVIVSDVFRTFGPITGMRTNSRFYSSIKPNVDLAFSQGFRPPHITIQMPVYKESLQGVIIPTLRSLKAAISFYESHGGSASVFVNDDGMAFLTDEEREERIDFYHDNNVG